MRAPDGAADLTSRLLRRGTVERWRVDSTIHRVKKSLIRDGAICARCRQSTKPRELTVILATRDIPQLFCVQCCFDAEPRDLRTVALELSTVVLDAPRKRDRQFYERPEETIDDIRICWVRHAEKPGCPRPHAFKSYDANILDAIDDDRWDSVSVSIGSELYVMNKREQS